MKLHGNDIMKLGLYDKKTLCAIIAENKKQLQPLTKPEKQFVRLCESTVHFLDFTEGFLPQKLRLYGDEVEALAMAGAMLYSGIFRPETCDRSVCDARSCCDLLGSNSLLFDVPCYKIMKIIKSGSIINERPAYLRIGNGCIPLIFLQTPCTY